MSKFIQPDISVLDIKSPLNLHFSISEIFHSLQGEGLRAGERCVFIRLQGCSLRCSWCDTAYALDHNKGGFDMVGEEIVSKIEEFNCNFIEFTGGEPLEQVNIYPLMTLLCAKGYTVAIETGGHINTQFVDKRVIKIIDMNGKLVQEAKGEGTVCIPLNKLKAGTYMINVESATKIWNKPLIIR